MDIETQVNRRRLLQIGGGLGLAGLLAACGGDDDSGSGGNSAAATGAAPPEQATSVAEDTGGASSAEGGASSAEGGATTGELGGGVSLNLDPSTEKGALEVFDWQGYDDKSGPFWDAYVNGPYGKSNPLKFTFLEDDQQALAKVAAGFKTDVMHPCIAYTKNWMDADLIQPWDVNYIEGFENIEPRLYEAGTFDGKVYMVPWDWGFSSLLFRGDRVEPNELSWNLIMDERYKGRIGMYSDGVTIIKIGGLINGVSDPNKMSSDEIQAAKDTMIKAKPNIRMFWTSQPDAMKEVVAGNIDIMYAWQDAYFSVKKELPDADIQYMQPKEGRLAWICGYILAKDTARPALAHEMMKCVLTEENVLGLINDYAYGAAGATPEILDKVTNKEAVDTFGLRDLGAAFAPGVTWPEAYLENRADYVKAAEEVKAA
jgi:spermidine/putrescine transport system substrate-binding protein